MKHPRDRLTYANVISTLCLFLLLGGGTALATGALGKNTVGSKQLRKNAVTGVKVKNGSLTAGDLKAGTIPSVYTKTESDSRYLRGTVTVISEIGKIKAGKFGTAEAACPSGYQTTGGGVDASNVLNGYVSESGPAYNGKIAFEQGTGQKGPATGWLGVVTAGNGVEEEAGSLVIAVCAPLG